MPRPASDWITTLPTDRLIAEFSVWSADLIRLAEELARCWGNIDYGLRELSRRAGESEMEAYAWDLETNTMSSQKFTVKHIREMEAAGMKKLVPATRSSKRHATATVRDGSARRSRIAVMN